MKKIIILSLIACTSCAKMINGSHQTIHLENLSKEALVVVSNDEGSKLVTNTTSPHMELELARSSPYTIEIKQIGHETKAVEIKRSLSPLVLTYILPGGMLMLAADSATSSQFNLSPSQIDAELTPTTDSQGNHFFSVSTHHEETTTAALACFRSIMQAVFITA